MKRFWDIVIMIVKWFIRRKGLYRLAGIASVAYIFVELNSADIPTEAEPNYTEIGEKYGETLKAISGWLVDKFGSGINWLGVAIALFILLICLLIEFNVIKPQKVINAKNVFSGWFQINTIKNYKIFRRPFKVNKDYFDRLKTRHFTKEFTSKYNENLFVDQDRNAGQKLINEILLNNEHFPYLTNELRTLADWIKDFNNAYQNLKSLLDTEGIEINKNSKQYKQLEFLEVKSQDFLRSNQENQEIINGGLILPLQFKTLDNTNLEIPEDFVFERLQEYKPEYHFIEEEPSDNFAIIIVFRRLTEIITQLKRVNGLLENQKYSQNKFIHGNAGMGKSNFSAFIYTELLKQNKPTIIIGGKSFNGDPDGFDKLLMGNLMVPGLATFVGTLS